MPITPKGDKHQFAVSRLLLPANNTAYAFDLTGSGHKVNALGGIIQAISSQGFDVQSNIDTAVNDGSVSLLMSIQTSDATLQSDSATGVTIYLGTKFANCTPAVDGGTVSGTCPDFSGAGMFTIDTAPADVPADGWPTFVGKIASGAFSSNNPATAKAGSANPPISITLNIPLVGGDPISLKLNGGHVAFTSAMDSGHIKLTGQIQGSIKNADIQNSIMPSVASLLTAQIKKDPTSSAAKQIAMIFDTGCTDDSGAVIKNDGGLPAGTAGDGIIQLCEVQTNAIISSVLSPDIQVYDAMGNYAPNPKPTAASKDSLSLGLQFEAVPGMFPAAQ